MLHTVCVDFNQENGAIRPMHATNNGPINGVGFGGQIMTIVPKRTNFVCIWANNSNTRCCCWMATTMPNWWCCEIRRKHTTDAQHGVLIKSHCLILSRKKLPYDEALLRHTAVAFLLFPKIFGSRF